MHKIAILDLGYVGLPLAVEFAKIFPAIGLDINKQRISELENGVDRTLEVTVAQLFESQKLAFTTNFIDIKKQGSDVAAVSCKLLNFDLFKIQNT
jgi:UDP-N-acetyl-D-glucosamine/UDP-N-acetyl-D-galactosamine dehydrogenase